MKKILFAFLFISLLLSKTYADSEAVFNQASDILITDTGGYYAGTEVETALQEIGAGTPFSTLYLALDASNQASWAPTTALVTNLNADLLDSQTGSYYLDSANFTGTNWTDLTDSGQTTLHSHAGGGGAPTDATYIVQTANGTLTNEQILADLATGIVKNTTTTGVLSIAADGTDYLSPAYISDAIYGVGWNGDTTHAPSKNAVYDKIETIGGAGAPTNAAYVVLGLDGTLSDERVLIGTANQITVTDGGAGGNVTLSTPQNLHTGASPTFAGLTLSSLTSELLKVNGSGVFAEAVAGTDYVAPTTTAIRSFTLSALGGVPSETSGCGAVKQDELATNNHNFFTLDFDATSQEYAEWELTMPDNWDGGTVTATFYWQHAATTVNFGVRWGLQGRSYGDNEAINQAWGTAQEVTDTGGTTTNLYKSDATSAITLAGTPAAGEFVRWRAYRLPSHAGDTMAIDANLKAIKIEHGINNYSE